MPGARRVFKNQGEKIVPRTQATTDKNNNHLMAGAFVMLNVSCMLQTIEKYARTTAP